MKQRLQSIKNPRRLLLFIVLMALVSAGLLLWAQDIVREVFVLPISYLIFLFGVIISTTPQFYFWVVLMMITFMMAYRSMKRKRLPPERMPPSSLAELSQDPMRRGRVTYWSNKVTLMRSTGSNFYTSNFHQTLGRLLIEMLSYRYRLPVIEIEQRLRSETLDVPPQVSEYVLHNMRPLAPDQRSTLVIIWEEIVQAVKSFLEGRFPRESRAGGNNPADQVDPNTAWILNYMEKELEVPHGDSGH
jgi:hypothetical protein